MTFYIYKKKELNMNILLISEDAIRTLTGLDDNVFGKNLLPSIRESQDIGLQSIIGSCLYQRLCSMVEDGSITSQENSHYKLLLDNQIKYYLLYQVIYNLIPIIGVKLANIGVVMSNDEHIQNITEDERSRVATYYEQKADWYAKRLQEFLKANKDLYPELDCGCECDGSIKPNLDSAASTGIFLGGYRSPYPRIIMRKICC